LRPRTDPPLALKAGGIELDPVACKVRRDGSDLDLTATEFRLLEVLMGRPGVVFARGQLLDTVWGYQRAVNERAVDVYILRLRQKIEADPADPRLIRSVRGFGYSFQAESAVAV
jgi:DNA-binding response OmpR family regulator